MTLCDRCNHEAVTERPPHLCALHYLENRLYDAWASGDDREAAPHHRWPRGDPRRTAEIGG